MEEGKLNSAAQEPSLNHWLDLPAALLLETGTIRLRESPGTDVSGLLTRLRNGSYSKPFVVDDGTFRRLHFSLDTVQSKMCIDEPYELNFAYTRKMMAFLLFVPNPRDVVIVGLGGGSLTKFCYRQLPHARVTTVEVDRDVIEFGRLFNVPGEDARMRIVHADAVEYFASSEESADVIMIDGCDKRGVAPAFCNENFYRTLRSRLRPGGMLVMNLIGPSHVMRAHLRHIEREFGGRHIVLELSTCSNQLVFAFNDPLFSPDWSAIRDSVDLLTLQYGLDFPYYFSKLRHACNFASRRLRRPRKTQDRRDAMND